MAKPFASWNSYEVFQLSIRHQARYFFDRKARHFLSVVKSTSEKRVTELAVGNVIWRAQVGHAWVPKTYGDSKFEEPAPFAPERMKPLRYGAHEGRVNVRGIPCLYASNVRDTAVAEVRPWVGALVSLAKMKVNRPLRLVNCGGDPDIEHEIWFEQPSPEEREEIVWRAIGRAFSNPASSDPSIAEYAPTQVLAEHFRQLGYDGALFRSSLGPGLNVAFFDIEAVGVVDVRLVPVLGVKYTVGKEDSFHVKKHFKRIE